MKKIFFLFSLFLTVAVMSLISSCDTTPTSDQKLNSAQEDLMNEAVRQVGMPNIKNFTQRKNLKWIQELCDQEKLVNFAYNYSEMTGKYTFVGKCIGYAIPFSTQYTSPEKLVWRNSNGYHQMPQADPNGLFMPASSEASWVIMINPKDGTQHPSYSEPRLYISAFPLDDEIVTNPNMNPKN